MFRLMICVQESIITNLTSLNSYVLAKVIYLTLSDAKTLEFDVI